MKNCPVDGTTCDCGMNYCAVALRCFVAAQIERLYGHAAGLEQADLHPITGPHEYVDAATGAIEEHAAAPEGELVKWLRAMSNESGGGVVEERLLQAADALSRREGPSEEAVRVETERATAQRCVEICINNIPDRTCFYNHGCNDCATEIRSAYPQHFEGETMTDAERNATLLPCPFCGAPAESEPWHGGKKTKTMISCGNEKCDVLPAVTGETPNEAALRWNRRYKEKT
jgi:hypothetical protein